MPSLWQFRPIRKKRKSPNKEAQPLTRLITVHAQTVLTARRCTTPARRNRPKFIEILRNDDKPLVTILQRCNRSSREAAAGIGGISHSAENICIQQNHSSSVRPYSDSLE